MFYAHRCPEAKEIVTISAALEPSAGAGLVRRVYKRACLQRIRNTCGTGSGS